MSDILVVAVGGNALLPAADSADAMPRRLARAAAAIAAAARRQPTVITHGNGPQIGMLVERERAGARDAPLHLDVLGAQTAGHLGYWFTQHLGRHLGQDRVAAVVTRVVVAADDPSFTRPAKPIGPAGGPRTLVASPEPLRVLELEAVRALLAAGLTVVCLGGGGIPVVTARGDSHGVDGVIDKDLSSAMLATALGATGLVILTDVDGVYRDFGSAAARLIRSGGVTAMRELDLPSGSMGPKVEALCRFVDGGGRVAACGALDQADQVLSGHAGTRVLAGAHPIRYERAAPALIP